MARKGRVGPGKARIAARFSISTLGILEKGETPWNAPLDNRQKTLQDWVGIVDCLGMRKTLRSRFQLLCNFLHLMAVRQDVETPFEGLNLCAILGRSRYGDARAMRFCGAVSDGAAPPFGVRDPGPGPGDRELPFPG